MAPVSSAAGARVRWRDRLLTRCSAKSGLSRDFSSKASTDILEVDGKTAFASTVISFPAISVASRAASSRTVGSSSSACMGTADPRSDCR